jgi:heme-degrading monooxygenase HmoA
MEGMWRQDVLALCGLLRFAAFVCPHGPSDTSNLNWIVTHGIDRIRTVRVLDISDPDFIFYINPAKARPGVDPAVIGAAVRDAILRGTYGKSGMDPSAQPQTVETLDITFTTIAEFGASFADAMKLLDLEDTSGFREHAALHSENPIVRSFWRNIEAMRRPTDREPFLGSARRRVGRSTLGRRSREMLSEPREVIDWRRAMDEHEIVLVNLSYDKRGIVSEDQALTIGALIMNDIHLACRGRGQDSPKAYLYWDEVHRFVTEAAARLFTETRKFNLHPVFAHQIFDQLDETSPFIKGAIMSCRNKIFFGGLPPSNADLAARFAFRGQLDLQKPKHLYDKPVVVGQELAWLLSENESHSVGIAESTNWSRGGSETISNSTMRGTSATTNEGANEGISFTTNADGQAVAQSQSEGTAAATSETESLSETETVANSTNWSEGGGTTHTVTNARGSARGQTFKSAFKVMPTTGYTLPELLEMAAAKIAGLKQAEAIVKIGIRPAAKIRTLRIREGWATPEHITRAKARIATTTPYMRPIDKPAPAVLPSVPKQLPAPSATAPDGVPLQQPRDGAPAPTDLSDPEWG